MILLPLLLQFSAIIGFWSTKDSPKNLTIFNWNSSTYIVSLSTFKPCIILLVGWYRKRYNVNFAHSLLFAFPLYLSHFANQMHVFKALFSFFCLIIKSLPLKNLVWFLERLKDGDHGFFILRSMDDLMFLILVKCFLKV